MFPNSGLLSQSEAKRTIDFTPWFILSGLAIVGMTVLSLMTQPWGIGLSPDSGVYISAARNLLQGQGLSYIAPEGETALMTQWPPLYPTLLAIVGFLLKIDPLAVTRGLNISLFGANILLAGLTLKRYTRSLWIAGLGSFFMLTSFCMLENHSLAQSEPAFYFFGFLGLFLLAIHIDEEEKPLLLVASSLAISLAFVNRYAGAAFVATGLVALLLFQRKAWFKKIKEGTIFAALASFPMALWLIRNVYGAHNLWNRKLGFHPLGLDNLKDVLTTVSRWLLPSRVPPTVGSVVTLVAVAALLGVGLRLMLKEKEERQNTTLISLLVTFIFCYSGVLLAHVTCFQSYYELDDRYLSPLFVAGLLLLLSLADRLWVAVKGKPVFRASLIGFLALFAGFYLVQGAQWALNTRKEGPWQVTTAWKNFPILQKVRALPAETLIYSNQQHAIYLLTGHPASALPTKGEGNQPRENYLDELAGIKETFKGRDGILVYFSGKKIARWYYPTEKELNETLALHLIERVAEGASTDGAIYKLKKP